jgi:secondary thiamine-phosphate synthase enzyme
MSNLARAGWPGPSLIVGTETLVVHTERPLQILDLTPEVEECVRRAGLWEGIANVQVMHTTVGLLVNEREPLLFHDLERTLERLAPRRGDYRHDDLVRRRPAPPPDERRNGHAHCRAMVLRTAETLNVRQGALHLGRWQRLLLAELDGPQSRSVSVALLGAARG